MNKLLALLAFVAIGGFIGILVMEVPQPDLMSVALLTFLLVAYDFATSARDKKD
ncbi:hypothetical protein [Meridianimarinicoccus roseus]|jgi:uncharacterized membrane protein YfcA|uniref:hypothetical protein n=1 Tax=Meridianimarinicoccus roseus TaxID=2072018 RepID=UPI001EE692D9|nr:hypothetical protein [Meridianimarinicoccus roseus]